VYKKIHYKIFIVVKKKKQKVFATHCISEIENFYGNNKYHFFFGKAQKSANKSLSK
jgi:hypothetical protein